MWGLIFSNVYFELTEGYEVSPGEKEPISAANDTSDDCIQKCLCECNATNLNSPMVPCELLYLF